MHLCETAFTVKRAAQRHWKHRIMSCRHVKEQCSFGLKSFLTLRCDLSFLFLQIEGAVGFKSVHTSQLSEAAEERLLFLLCVCRQNLLGQAQFLVNLSLLIVWRDSGRRNSETLTFSEFSTRDVLDDLCKEQKKRFTFNEQIVLAKHRWHDRHLFTGCIQAFSWLSHACWDGNQGKMLEGCIHSWCPAWVICTFILLINSIKGLRNQFFVPMSWEDFTNFEVWKRILALKRCFLLMIQLKQKRCFTKEQKEHIQL